MATNNLGEASERRDALGDSKQYTKNLEVRVEIPPEIEEMARCELRNDPDRKFIDDILLEFVNPTIVFVDEQGNEIS